MAQGFSFIEVLIAMAILAIVSLGLSRSSQQIWHLEKQSYRETLDTIARSP